MSEFSTSARNSRSRIMHPKSKRILRIIKIEDDEDQPVQTERSRSRSISPLRYNLELFSCIFYNLERLSQPDFPSFNPVVHLVVIIMEKGIVLEVT